MKTALYLALATGIVCAGACVACTPQAPDETTADTPPAHPPIESGGGGANASSGSGAGASGGAGTGTGGSTPVAPVKTVLLIPGTAITGDYFDTMVDRLVADGFTPVVYESPDLMTASLAEEAEQIGAVVQALLAQTGEARVHIVAECDGGVATRYYLQRLGGHAFVDQVVTFVSAHHGTWLSPVGAWVTGWQALADIKPDSAFMADLNTASFPADLHLTSIYSCNDEFMVPYDTSVVGGATNVLFCDHYVSHLGSFWDALVYERIHAALVGEGEAAPTQY